MSYLIPKARAEKAGSGKTDLSKGICISSNAFDDGALAVFLQRMEKKGIEAAAAGEREGAVSIGIFRVSGNAVGSKEAYELTISEDGISIRTADRLGAIGALTSLCQLIGPDKSLPHMEISDGPRFAYRGIHIDSARHFFSTEDIKRIIEEISLVKINKLHWHLSDDQGFRVETGRYPELTAQCNALFYSKSEIREIVDFASARGIEIIPEIDMPGHTRAIIAVHPELSCKEERVTLATCGGIYPAIICPGKEASFEFIENILDEIIPLFPGEFFHIGGDEAPKHNWRSCPACRKRMETEGLKDETALQGYFLRRVSEHIKEKFGKRIICWNDSLEFVDELKGDELVQYWSMEHKKQLPEFIEKGGHFVYSDMFDLYYDYPAAMSPMKRSYSFLPVIGEKDYGNSDVLIGYECCNWSEYTSDGRSLERKIFPRLYAMAEKAWSEVTASDYIDFRKRLKYYKNNVTGVTWGSGDPRGVRKQMEKLAYAITMSKGMPKEVREQTVAAAQVSDEFMVLFREKMLR